MGENPQYPQQTWAYAYDPNYNQAQYIPPPPGTQPDYSSYFQNPTASQQAYYTYPNTAQATNSTYPPGIVPDFSAQLSSNAQPDPPGNTYIAAFDPNNYYQTQTYAAAVYSNQPTAASPTITPTVTTTFPGFPIQPAPPGTIKEVTPAISVPTTIANITPSRTTTSDRSSTMQASTNLFSTTGSSAINKSKDAEPKPFTLDKVQQTTSGIANLNVGSNVQSSKEKTKHKPAYHPIKMTKLSKKRLTEVSRR